MNEYVQPPVSSSPGYLSEQGRRKFTLIAGLLGAGAFLAQFAVPFVAMFVIMSSFMFSPLKMSELDKGAYWRDAYWFVEVSRSAFEPESRGEAVLVRFGADEQREEVSSLPESLSEAWLLSDADRLWLIDSDTVGFLVDGDVVVEEPTQTLGDFSRPFFYEGRPAVVSETPVGLTLRVYADGDWQVAGALDASLEEQDCCLDRLQVVESGGKLYSFMKHDKWLYSFEGLPLQGQNGKWEPVARSGWTWMAVSGPSEPVVFHQQDNAIVGLERSGSEWPEFCSIKVDFAVQVGAYRLGEDRYGLALEGFPGSIRFVQVVNGEVADKSKLRRSFFPTFMFPHFMMGMMVMFYAGMIFLPLILAALFTFFMNKYRVLQYSTVSGDFPFASIWRRGMAQLIDGLFQAGPGFALMIAAFWMVRDSERSAFQELHLWFFVFILFTFVWWVVSLGVFGFLEGRWGRTPGKWVVGIRVLGTDLKPCGFVRGLIRNVLLIVDGMFSYMVGILLVALTENWQRIGDLAARTVVVKAPRSAAAEPDGHRQFVK